MIQAARSLFCFFFLLLLLLLLNFRSQGYCCIFHIFGMGSSSNPLGLIFGFIMLLGRGQTLVR